MGRAPVADRGWLHHLFKLVRPHRRLVAIAFAAALAGMAATAVTPLAFRAIVDGLDTGISIRAGVLALLALGVARFVAAYGRRWYGGRLALDVENDLRIRVFDQLQRLDFARHDELQTGQLVSRANSDIRMVQLLLAFLPLMSGNVLLLAASIVVMLVLSPVLTLITLAVVPALVIVGLRLRRVTYPSAWDAQARAADLTTIAEEAIAGVRIVKGFGQEQRELDRLEAAARRLYGSRVRNVAMTARYAPLLQTIPVLGQAGILVAGGWLVIEGQLTLGTFLAFSTYLVQLVGPVRMLAFFLSAAQSARAGAERVFEILHSNPQVIEAADAVALPPAAGEISFTDVRFGYLRSEPVLDGFTLRVAAGETVALVGESGSGKSTVALLLPRFYDVQDGAVTVDGHDVRDVTLDSLRRQVGVVFEDSFLFSTTVRENIAYGRPDATDAEVEAAARAAEAHDFVMDLPAGYATVVGERGLTLSGGQRQRIALARALLTDPCILVLDDATSAIDVRVEQEIYRTLRHVAAERTTILIARRRSTLALADRIVVVERGRVLDSGTHDELTERCAAYRKLFSGDDAEADEVQAEGTVTASAWAVAATPGGLGPAMPPTDFAPPMPSAAGFGPARPGLGGPGPAALLAPPTPELQARIAALPPATAAPDVDVARETQPAPEFRMRTFLLPYRWGIGVGILLVTLDALAVLAGPALVQVGVDQGIMRGNTERLLIVTAWFLAVALADLVVMRAQTIWAGRLAERLLYAMRLRVFAQLQRLGLDFYDREMDGRILTRLTSDVDALATFLQTGLLSLVVNVCTLLGIGVVLFVYDWRLALVAVGALPILTAGVLWFRRASDRAYLEVRDRIAAVMANLQEGVSGVRVAQAFTRERRNMRDFRDLSGRHLDARLVGQRIQSVFFPGVEFLGVVASAAVLGVGANFVSAGTLTTGALIAFVLYVDRFFSPIQQLSQVFDSYQQSRAALVKLRELLALPVATPDGDSLLDSTRGELVFDNVAFTYPGANKPAVEGVSFTVAPGETVALVGETGAGKSTLLRLAIRYHDPVAGRVLVDDRDLRSLDLASYRSRVGIVPQESFLFSGTVRDNIAYARPGASDAEVEAAARAVGAHEAIARRPGGYLAPVTERGRSLSAGERQLLALARAHLVDPAILLLDEATSNLDMATEARVQAAMGVLRHGRTTLLIAHRLPTAARADRIVVLDAGRVVEEGTHRDLLAAGGPYAQMWAAWEAAPAEDVA